MTTSRAARRAEDVRRRVEPHRLLEDGERAGHRTQVLVRGSATRGRVHLRLDARARLRVLREQVQRPRQRRRRRLVPGEEEGHRLVADLLIVIDAAVLVPRREQHAEEVAAVRRPARAARAMMR